MPARLLKRAAAFLAMLFVTAIPTLGVAGAAPPTLPTMDELREIYDSGDYRTTLQQVARAMRATGPAADAYDREQLQLLRAQALISSNDPRTAKRVLEEIANSAQPKVATHARGLLALLARSKGTTYTPRTGDRTPLDISDPATRKRALAAVLNDEIDGLAAAAKPALAADDLKLTIELVPKLVDLNAVEKIASDGDERTGPIVTAIGEHARTLIARELTIQEERISGIENMANTIYETERRIRPPGAGRGWGGTITRRGLTSDERAALYDLVEYLRKIEETAKAAQRAARLADGNVEAWNDIVTQAVKVTAHAMAVLEAEGVKTVGD